LQKNLCIKLVIIISESVKFHKILFHKLVVLQWTS